MVDKSHESTFLVESGVGRDYLVEPKPSELAQDVLMSFSESVIFVEIFDTLPVFKGFFIREDTLVNFQKGSLFNTSIVVGFISALEEERLEIEEDLEGVGSRVFRNDSLDFNDPIFIEGSEFLFKELIDSRVSWVLEELFSQNVQIASGVTLSYREDWGNISEVIFGSGFSSILA